MEQCRQEQHAPEEMVLPTQFRKLRVRDDRYSVDEE
jgi:hypothetical protein